MKSIALLALLLASPVFAQEIIIAGHFPPQSMEDIEIIAPEGWIQEHVEKIPNSDATPMQGVKLRYKDAQGKEHSVWVVFSLED